MTSRFDPSAFITAERAGAPAVETIAADAIVGDAFALPSERADFRRFQADREGNNRTIEGIEAQPSTDRPWSLGLHELGLLPRPYWLKAKRWDRLIYICNRLDAQYGDEAVAKGWSAHDLFGCHPSPAQCAGTWLNGLAATIFGLATPVKIIEMGADAVTLQPAIEPLGNIPAPPGGPAMRFRRHTGNRPGQSLIWHAYAFESGP